MRTRFAPSPTGLLHVGGLRTALFAWLVAKQSKGTFILRIEDTDQARSLPGAVENILRTLEWVGLSPDEGVILDNDVPIQKGNKGPYVQSERLDLYKKYATQLITSGHAYPCFCTEERLTQMREEQMKQKRAPMYDRHCLSLSPDEVKKRLENNEKHVIRLKMPHGEKIQIEDEVRGPVEFQAHLVDDQVLVKSDGFPTYHLAHVIDDHLMEIDMVIRGEEWLSSLPKHIVLFEALEWNSPKYAHIPLLLNKDRTKLSKRQGDVSAESYAEKGYLPEAMINFLAFLGWNPGTTQELFSPKELIEAFSLDRVQKSGAVFDLEKLDWLQGQWIRKMSPKEFADRIRPIVSAQFLEAKSDKDFEKKTTLIQERVTLLPEASDMMSFFYETPTVSEEVLLNKKQGVEKNTIATLIDALLESLEQISDKQWNEESIKAALEDMMIKKDLKRGQVLWPLRAILTGKPFSPGAFEVAAALGKKETIARLKSAA